MDVGKRDRYVYVQTDPKAVDSLGGPDPTAAWTTWRTAWAFKRDAGGREVEQGGLSLAEVTTIWVMPWLDGLTMEHRLHDPQSGEDYAIVNIKELGRRELVELLTRRLTE